MQSLCVLGYCALPLLLALLLNRLFSLFLSASAPNVRATPGPATSRDGFLAQSILFIRFLIALAAVVWSTFGALHLLYTSLALD